VLAFAHRMLGDRAEAEDVVQETFLKAHRPARRFDGRSAPSTWVFAIARNACLDRLRGRRLRSFSSLEAVVAQVPAALRSTYCHGFDPEVGLNIREADDLADFRRRCTPHRAYHRDLLEVTPVITPAEALQLLLDTRDRPGRGRSATRGRRRRPSVLRPSLTACPPSP
jgi:RNA polymerase sigma factor (sigma-70 family)